MRKTLWLLAAIQTFLVVSVCVGVSQGWFPLGVPGEWTWTRITARPSPLGWLLGLTSLGGYTGFAIIGFRSLQGRAGQAREGFWLAGLALMAILTQGAMQESAPEGYGLSKWIFALHAPGSSGYYTVARKQMADPSRFLAEYPDWITRQDALHVGTHPPGLFVLSRGVLNLMEASPKLTRWVIAFSPGSLATSIRLFRESVGLARPDAAALAITGALTMFACSLTVVPLYLLARSQQNGPGAWVAAVLWPLVPSSLLFQPTADTAFPLLATTALTLASWSGRVSWPRGVWLCLLCGLVLALGMIFTLAFLPVGLVVALILGGDRERSGKTRMGWIAATGLGFLGGTLIWWGLSSANPFVIWWVNQKNHARFYAEYPRSYLAWVVENPLELIVSLGLPASLWGGIGLSWSRRESRVACLTIFVLIFLTISGKNLSEVARLWIPLMPALLVASASGFVRAGGTSGSLGVTIGLMGLQTLWLQALIQVVYPV